MKAGYRFRDPQLLRLAMTHRSAGRPNNERLEFLGDALVNLIVAELLYETHPKADEGELSRLRAQLVSGAALAGRARAMGLGEDLLLGPGELKSGGHRRDSILADAFEALVAAVYLDGGFDACRAWLRELFVESMDAAAHAEKDPKTRLQEWLQGLGFPLPRYELLATHGEEHARAFEVACVLTEPAPAQYEGRGGNRRAAEQAAAEAALASLAGPGET